MTYLKNQKKEKTKPWPPNKWQVGAHKGNLLLSASRCDTWGKEDLVVLSPIAIHWASFNPSQTCYHLILSSRVPATTLDKKLTTPLTPGSKQSLSSWPLLLPPPMIETSLSSWLWVKARFFQWARKPLPTTRKRNLRKIEISRFLEATWSARAGRNPSLWKSPSQDRPLQPSASHTCQPFRCQAKMSN